MSGENFEPMLAELEELDRLTVIQMQLKLQLLAADVGLEIDFGIKLLY